MTKTLIRHAPDTKLRTATDREVTFLLKSSTPYVAAFKRINKQLEKLTLKQTAKYQRGPYARVKFFTIKAMGRAIDLAMSLALTYQLKQGYKVDIITGTQLVMDEIKTSLGLGCKDDESDDDSSYRSRRAATVEVRIWLNK